MPKWNSDDWNETYQKSFSAWGRWGGMDNWGELNKSTYCQSLCVRMRDSPDAFPYVYEQAFAGDDLCIQILYVLSKYNRKEYGIYRKVVRELRKTYGR